MLFLLVSTEVFSFTICVLFTISVETADTDEFVSCLIKLLATSVTVRIEVVVVVVVVEVVVEVEGVDRP